MSASEYLTPKQVANEYLPKVLGRRPHMATIIRLCGRGFRTATGERIRLPHLRMGRSICIKISDILPYFEQLAKASASEHVIERAQATPRVSTPSQRQAQIEAARRELRAPVSAKVAR
jgi:hypothetical protein